MMIVDTSVWIDHMREGDAALSAALEAGLVCVHPSMVGELACGKLKRRKKVFAPPARLPLAPTATDLEAPAFIERRDLMGRGIGYIGVHLLASASLGRETRLWTRDRRLDTVAGELSLAVGSRA
jgi:predicted nucleic acid-binding protein